MNYTKLKNVFNHYKQIKPNIVKDELYKWQAIKVFQDHWDLNADSFPEMLRLSLSGTKNLLTDGRYFAAVMINRFADHDPARVKQLFVELFDEGKNLIERVESFRQECKAIVRTISTIDNKRLLEFQDMRAVYAYLTLKYPEKYFFYKHEMYMGFAELIDYPHLPIAGRISNLAHFQQMAELIREEVKKDSELIRIGQLNIDDSCYPDTNYNLLTQDIMWVTLSYPFEQSEIDIVATPFGTLDIIDVETESTTKTFQGSFKGNKTDHKKRQQANSLLGSLGELLVLKHEKSFLLNHGKVNLAKKVEHVSVTRGDGEGFDILSFTLKGKPKLIEVKTTVSDVSSPIFLTRTEVERSKQDSEHYYLYRLFDFDKQNTSAKAVVIQGNIAEQLDLYPEVYTTILKTTN